MFKKTVLTVSFLTVLAIFISSERLLNPAQSAVQYDSVQTILPLVSTVEATTSNVTKAPATTVAVKKSGNRSISAYDDMMRRAAAESGHDWRLLSAIAYHESRFNPEAVSKVGAFGLMQIMPRVAEHDSALGQVVGRHFQSNRITGQDPDEIETHFTADVSENIMAVLKFHQEHGVRKQFFDYSFNSDDVFRHGLKPPFGLLQ